MHEAELLLRQHPRKDAYARDTPAQVPFVHVFDLASGDEFVCGVEADRAPDGIGGRWVVACDHRHFDAGFTAILDGLWHRRAHRIGEADQTEKLEIEIMLRCRPVIAAEACFRNRQDAESVLCHGFDCSIVLGASKRVEVT